MVTCDRGPASREENRCRINLKGFNTDSIKIHQFSAPLAPRHRHSPYSAEYANEIDSNPFFFLFLISLSLSFIRMNEVICDMFGSSNLSQRKRSQIYGVYSRFENDNDSSSRHSRIESVIADRKEKIISQRCCGSRQRILY